MLRAGADGFINKETGKQELLRVLEKVMHGEKYLSPEISNNLIMHLSNPAFRHSEEDKKLTAREREIVSHIADGLTNQEIAGKLFLSVVTVDTHRKNILAKLQLKILPLLLNMQWKINYCEMNGKLPN